MLCDAVLALTLGHEHVPKALSLEGAGRERLRLPIIALLADTSAGWALLDTGISPALREPAPAEAIYGRGHAPEIPGDGHPLVDALSAVGLGIGDIAVAAVSHLHVDHSGGLALLQDGPPVFVQRRELAFARTPAAEGAAYVPSDYAGPIDWRELDGDGPIAPGVEAVSTPGHTPGHMSYRVRTAETTWLFAMDAIDLQEGIDTDTPIGSASDPADAPLLRASHDRLVALAAAEGARLVPGHCPVTWPPPELRSIAL